MNQLVETPLSKELLKNLEYELFLCNVFSVFTIHNYVIINKDTENVSYF